MQQQAQNDAQQRHEEAMAAAKYAALQARCAALAAVVVLPFDEDNPAYDFRRWAAAICKEARTAGPDFLAALLADGVAANAVPRIATGANTLPWHSSSERLLRRAAATRNAAARAAFSHLKLHQAYGRGCKAHQAQAARWRLDR